MTATILPFIPRPNPKSEAEQLAVAVVNAMCWPWLAWADQFDADLYAKGLAIDTAPKSDAFSVSDIAWGTRAIPAGLAIDTAPCDVLHTSDYIAPDDDCA